MNIGAETLDRTAGPRTLQAGPAFWGAMLAASALGTNLGDFCADVMPPRLGFVLLAFVCALAVVADRRARRWTEAGYWVAIVTLRAAATNVADALTHGAGFGYGSTAVVLAAAACALGWRTRPGPARARSALLASPLIDGWYWAAMLVAGVFGTVAGDLVAYTTGLLAAALLLSAILAFVLGVGAWRYSGAMLAYWAAVLAERCAGTPLGDGLASRHGAGLGLPVAMACTGGVFLAMLQWRRMATVPA